MGKASKQAQPEAVEAAPAPQFAKVTNKRKGTIMCGPHGGLAFEPGVTVVDASVLRALPVGTQDAISDMVDEGWLSIDPYDSSEPESPVLPELVPVLPEADPRPTVEQVNTSTSAAELDAWFHIPGLSAELSEAILARHSALSPA